MLTLSQVVVLKAMAVRDDCVHLVSSLPPHFSLQKAVCSYGFFMMAPNLWVDPSPASTSGFLERPLRLHDGRAVQSRISESNNQLNICLFGLHQLEAQDEDFILAQVSRMLRLSDIEMSAMAAFHALHVQAGEEGFGRLFRSPTLFEDIVKSFLLCNCGWGRSLSMARALCEFQAELKGPPLGCPEDKVKKVDEMPSPLTPDVKEVKRKRSAKKRKHSKARKLVQFDGCISLHVESVSRLLESKEEIINGEANTCESPTNAAPTDSGASFYSAAAGAFPTPAEICAVDASVLAERCGLGYRGMRIWKLAKDIVDGVVDLQSFESPNSEPPLQLEDVRSKLLELQGIGPFTCANVLVCMGYYSTIPADTETVRHLRQVHDKRKCTMESVSKDVAAIYASFAPYQFLAYWYELWGAYERKFGKLSCMDPATYGLITGPNMRKKVIK